MRMSYSYSYCKVFLRLPTMSLVESTAAVLVKFYFQCLRHLMVDQNLLDSESLSKTWLSSSYLRSGPACLTDSHQLLQGSYHLTKPTSSALWPPSASPGVSTARFEDGHHEKHYQTCGHSSGQRPSEWRSRTWPTQTQGPRLHWDAVEGWILWTPIWYTGSNNSQNLSLIPPERSCSMSQESALVSQGPDLLWWVHRMVNPWWTALEFMEKGPVLTSPFPRTGYRVGPF